MFPSAIDGLRRGLKKQLSDDAFRNHLMTEGLSLNKLPPGIPLEQYERLLFSLAQFTWPQQSTDEAMRLLGFHIMQGLVETPLGSAIAGMMRIIGSERAIKRIDKMFRASDNFMEAKTALSPHEALITLNLALGGRTYFWGVFQSAFAALKPGSRVEIADSTPPGLVLRAQWN